VKLDAKLLFLGFILVSTPAFAQFGDILNRMKKEVETAVQKGTEAPSQSAPTTPSNMQSTPMQTTDGSKNLGLFKKFEGSWYPIEICAENERTQDRHHTYFVFLNNPPHGLRGMSYSKNYSGHISHEFKEFDEVTVDGKTFVKATRVTDDQRVGGKRTDSILYEFTGYSYLVYEMVSNGEKLVEKGKSVKEGVNDPRPWFNCKHEGTKTAVAQWQTQQRQATQTANANRDAALKQEVAKVQSQGLAFAKESNIKWQALVKKDGMTGKQIEFAQATVKDGGGQAEVRVSCIKDPQDKFARDTVNITFRINNLNVPTTFSNGNETATGRLSTNGNVQTMFLAFEKGSIDRFHAGILAGIVNAKNGFLCRKEPDILGICNFNDGNVEILHSLAASIKTRKGEIVAKIPPFDPAIKSIMKDCSGEQHLKLF
jgi:hypothetical protein